MSKSKSKYQINPNFILQLEIDELLKRIKELKIENSNLKKQLHEKEMQEMQPTKRNVDVLRVQDLK